MQSYSFVKVVIIFIASFQFITCFATTIVPFPNLGEMLQASEAVVFAEALPEKSVIRGEQTVYYQPMSLVELIKGDVPSDFELKLLKMKVGNWQRYIPEDIDLEPGRRYLIFLQKNGMGEWRPMMMAHAVFQQEISGSSEWLFPLSSGLNYQQMPRPDGREVEPIAPYPAQAFMAMLKSVANGTGSWNRQALLQSEQQRPQIFGQVDFYNAPSHCTFIKSNAPHARWFGFETNSAPVLSEAGGDSQCSSAISKVQGALTDIGNNYTGTNFVDGGTHSFSPDCASDGTANGPSFLNYLFNNGGYDQALVMFEDPCDEITDLTNCSGTLAFGGIYWFLPDTFLYNGEYWYPAAAGFVVTNNDMGSCYCNNGTTYDIIILHELTHALGVGHISSGQGQANMNPFCCNSISNLDIQCLDYMYQSQSLPVELLSFQATRAEDEVQLQWQTAAELNNDFFEVQRSTDGGDFSTIGMVKGAGTTEQVQRYTFTDPNPRAGTNYYRLRQVDFDGQFAFSATAAVEFQWAASRVFPNPAREVLYLERPDDQPVTVQLIDLTGRVVWQQVVGQWTEIPLKGLPGGMYQLRLETANGQEVKKVVIE